MIGLIEIATLLFIGLFAGLIIGIAGASGAGIMISLLYLVLNFSIHRSIGTTLMANAIASFFVFMIYYRNRNVDFAPCIWLALGAVPGSILGAFLGNMTPEIQLSGSFGTILIIMGIFLWKKGIDREEMIKRFSKILKIRNEYTKKGMSIFIGAIVGILSGIFGASGGVWFLVMLLLVFGQSLHRSIGGAAFLMMLTALSASMAHSMYGNVDTIGGLIMGIGASISGNLSAKFANKSTERVLIKSIAVIVALLGVLMIVLKSLIPSFRI